MLKNTAGQKWIIFAFGRTSNSPVTGDALNITANLRLDGGTANPIDDLNPTELEGGYYYFDLTEAETNGDLLVICPSSVTPDAIVIGVPGALFTEPAGRKYPATLAPADCSGNLPAAVNEQANIDFGALQKASLNAATPASVQNLTQGATAGELTAAVAPLATTALATKILQAIINRAVVDPSTGNYIIYADDGVTPLITGTLSDLGRGVPTWP